jgi:HEAT repeat protein
MTEEMPKKDDRPVAERISDPDELNRLAALGEILDSEQMLQEMAPEISLRLQDPEEDCRILALLAFEKMGNAGLRDIISALSPHQPVAVRSFAAGTLARMECDRTSALTDLCRCLLDENQGLRDQSSLALARIGAAAVPALHAALAAASGQTLIAVAQTLGQIGPPARETIPALNQQAAGQPIDVLIGIACAMIRILQNPESGFSFLVSSAADQPAWREKIIEQIGIVGPVVREGSDSILHYLHDPSPEVRAATSIALARMWLENVEQTPPHILDSLAYALDDPEPKVRANAGVAISAFGSHADRTVPALERHLADPDGQVSTISRAAIDKIRGQGSAQSA